MTKLNLNLTRNRETFMKKVSNMNSGTEDNYNMALNNFENFCMEKFGKADIVDQLKENSDTEILGLLQDWINWNEKLNPVTVLNLFSRVKKYLHHRGIKLHPQDIKDELIFPRKLIKEFYPLSADNITTITNKMNDKLTCQFFCQSSSMMRIGEICQLRRNHLILGGENIIVKLPETITKFNKARTTFFSKEASKLLYKELKLKVPNDLKKPYSKKVLRTDGKKKGELLIGENDLVFGSSEKVKHAETNSEQILRRVLESTGLNERHESTNRYKINTHSFRAFGIGKLSRLDPNFAKKLAGQKGYLIEEYDRLDDNEKLALYEKFEYALTIDSVKKHEAEIQELKDDKAELMKVNLENSNLKTKALTSFLDGLSKDDKIKILQGLKVEDDTFDRGDKKQ